MKGYLSPRLRQALDDGTLRQQARAASTPVVHPKHPTHRDFRSEKQVERAGDVLMHAFGFTVIRFSQPRNTMQTPGISDRRYYHPRRGVAVWWEAKRAGGVQSSHQRAFQALVATCGETYLVGTDAVLEDYLIAHGFARRGAQGELQPIRPLVPAPE